MALSDILFLSECFWGNFPQEIYDLYPCAEQSELAGPITSTKSPEVPVPSRRSNIDAHTGLRGLAAVVVFLAHLKLDRMFPGDWIRTACRFLEWQGQAVDLFFMLSGFVLCHVYAFAPSISWRKYGVARFARIYPLALATLLFCLSLDLYSFLRHGIASENLSMRKLAINGLLLNGLQDTWVHEGINPPSWSVSVEVFLYIVLFPMLTWFYRSQFRSRICVTIGVMFISLALLMSCYIFRNSLGNGVEYIWLARGVFGFSFGYSARQLIQQQPSATYLRTIMELLPNVVSSQELVRRRFRYELQGFCCLSSSVRSRCVH